MKGIKYIVSALVIFSLAISLNGQVSSIEELTPFQLLKFAKNAERAGDVFTAIFYFEKYREFRAHNSKVNYELATLHLHVRNYEQARDLFQIVVKDGGGKYPMAQFYYAQMLKSTGNYDEAIIQSKKKRYVSI